MIDAKTARISGPFSLVGLSSGRRRRHAVGHESGVGRNIVEIEEPVPFLLGFEPGIKARGDQTSGSPLLPGGLDGQAVGVLVLRVSGMTADPSPFNLVLAPRPDRGKPELEILDRSAFAFPAAPGPIVDPLFHSRDEVVTVGKEDDAAGPLQESQPLAGAAQRHALVRGIFLANEEVTPCPTTIVVEHLDKPSGAARRGAIAELVAETRLVGVYVDRIPERSSIHDS